MYRNAFCPLDLEKEQGTNKEISFNSRSIKLLKKAFVNIQKKKPKTILPDLNLNTLLKTWLIET